MIQKIHHFHGDRNFILKKYLLGDLKVVKARMRDLAEFDRDIIILNESEKENKEFVRENSNAYASKVIKNEIALRDKKRQAMNNENEETKVNSFFRNNIGISDEELENLKSEFAKHGLDLYKVCRNVTTMEAKRLIYESCNIGKDEYCNFRGLSKSLGVLYSRKQFFMQHNISIDSKNITLSRLAFGKKYGNMIAEKTNSDDICEYNSKVEKELLKNYQLPKTIGELKEKLNIKGKVMEEV